MLPTFKDIFLIEGNYGHRSNVAIALLYLDSVGLELNR
jgi:hypothetical protein